MSRLSSFARSAFSSSSADRPSHSPVSRFGPARELALVLALTAVAAWVTSYLNLDEAFYSLTRQWEFLQVDEWPIVALVLAAGLIWWSWRRNAHARSELSARMAVEAQLAAALMANREVTQRQLHAVESERKHLARELHDELGQYLNVIKLDAVTIGHDADGHRASCVEASSRILGAAEHILATVSAIIRRLRPAGLDELGVVAAVENCVDQWRQRSPSTVIDFNVSGSFETLSEVASLTVYRLVQECLTNTFKHAGARQIEVELSCFNVSQRQPSHLEVVLKISDDGVGMDTSKRCAGSGLRSMLERVVTLNGHFRIRSAPGAGCFVEARIPGIGVCRDG